MKKVIFNLILLVVFFTGLIKLDADCNGKIDAINVESYVYSYMEDETLTSRTVVIGLTENIYAIVINDYNDVIKTFHYGDTEDGMFHFDSENIYESINYKINFYNEDTSCGSDSLRTIDTKTNKYNSYSFNDICEKTIYELKLCDPFYDIGDMSIDQYMKELEKELDSIEGKDGFGYYLKKYCLFVIIPILLITIFYAIKIIKLKRGKRQ